MPENITFRTQLIEAVTKFCQESRLAFLTNTSHLVELIILLSRCQEEGVSLYPKVYLTNDKHTLNSMLPDGESLKIGSGEANVYGLQSAIKKCAPLAINGWLIYIEESVNMLEYGVFKGSGNPISVLVDEVLMTKNEEFSVVKAFQVAGDCVEIRANSGGFHYIFLNHRKEDSPPPLQFLDKLVDAITEKTREEDKEPTISFLNRLFYGALREAHGSIVAVTNMETPPKFLSSDGVILEEPVDFSKLVCEFKKKYVGQSHLDSKGHLLKGMLNSDGIILFDNKARLLGYNCFVKVSNKGNLIGGARKRAFFSVGEKIGHGISAVFMQSQDGWTDFKSTKNA